MGLPTRGTTGPNRLRRVDRHLATVHANLLRRASHPLVIDLGYGATPATAIELHRRLRAIRPDVEVVGLEIDQERVDAAWVTLTAEGPQTLTLAAHLQSLDRPGDLAERLPKALIHHHVPGQPIHALFRALDRAWDNSAPYTPFGNRQRWRAMCDALDCQQVGRREGEVTVPWTTVAP